jgi:malto-oligosyltrehalose trehalohydrolase
MRRCHELPFGAQPVANGVCFRLWAPDARQVSVRFEEDAPAALPMTAKGAGWFSLVTDRARPGTRYRYVVDGTAFPDPASRHQPQGVHGPSEVVDPSAYRWSDDAWGGRRWEEIVVYELHVGTFSPSGDFAGVEDRLDHVRGLGATAVELMPVADFPGARNWGYDGVQLFAPARCYGRPEALKHLVEACHRRGLAVFLDVVYNHFGPEGNYLTTLAPAFFTDRHRTPWGAAPDLGSRPVRDFFVHNALYWLEEFHFDGLRLDAVHAIHDDSEPDIVEEIAQAVRHRLPDRHIHLVLENDRNQSRYLAPSPNPPPQAGEDWLGAYDAQWNDDVHHALHVLVTGETAGYYADFAERPAACLGRALAEGFAYQGEPSPYRGGRPRGESSRHLPPTRFVAFLQNHDQVGNTAFGTRISANAPEAAVHAAVAIVLLSPQIPLLFMGEEWASGRPFAFFCDFEPGLADAVRDGRRREFARFPEFRDPAARARIPDPTAQATFAMSRLDWAELQREPHALWLQRYRRLLDIRAREIVPRLAPIGCCCGNYRVLGSLSVAVEWRLGDGSLLTLLANFAPEPLSAPLPAGRPLYGSGPDLTAPLSAAFFLAPP